MRKTVDIDHTGIGDPVRVSREIPTSLERAQAAARILAKREFGKNGILRTWRIDSWSEDRLTTTVQAFIGKRQKDGSCVGRNILIYTTLEV